MVKVNVAVVSVVSTAIFSTVGATFIFSIVDAMFIFSFAGAVTLLKEKIISIIVDIRRIKNISPLLTI
jgi:hypothetical protein